MSNKSGEDLIDTIRSRAARTTDTVLITEDFVLDTLNEAQLDIVKRTPRQIDLDSSSTTDYQISTDDVSIALTTIDPAHIGGIWILNGSDTRQAGIKYKTLEDFRRDHILVAQESSDEWIYYTRQGNTLLFNCKLASDYNGLYLKIDYTKKATDLANGATASVLSDSNELLIYFALAKVYDELALTNPKIETKALKTRVLFERCLADYQDYNTMCLEALYED